MKLFGITGGIAMGKSMAAELLRQRGVAVVDTDVIAREVVAPGQPALAEIRERFGADVFRADGGVDRAQLARRVFSDAGERAALEAILHPRIRAVWTERVAGWQREDARVGAVIIPLLFETQAADQFEAIICLACSAATQSLRLSRRGWPAEQVKQRIEAQWPIERKMAQSHFVVWTDTSVEVHGAQLDLILGR